MTDSTPDVPINNYKLADVTDLRDEYCRKHLVGEGNPLTVVTATDLNNINVVVSDLIITRSVKPKYLASCEIVIDGIVQKKVRKVVLTIEVGEVPTLVMERFLL